MPVEDNSAPLVDAVNLTVEYAGGETALQDVLELRNEGSDPAFKAAASLEGGVECEGEGYCGTYSEGVMISLEDMRPPSVSSRQLTIPVAPKLYTLPG